MTARNISLNAFALDAREGRTEPLNILGVETLVKVANADTDGALTIFQQTLLPLAGPPLHRHSNEDEWFYVLQGKLTFQIDGERSFHRAGSSVFAPRGTVHTFKNFEDVPAYILAVVTPGRFQHFSEDLSFSSSGQAVQDQGRIKTLASEYGIEILGPPLS